MKWYTQYRQNAFVQAYRDQENLISADSPSQALSGQSVLGILSISKINLTVAVREGVSRSDLRYAVGHFADTALPGQMGNCAITGHRSYAWGEYFNRLDELEAGDEVRIDYGGSTYTYSVTEKYVVDPDDAWVLNQAQSYELTLITCTPIRVGTQRLVIKALLIQP
jgi:sortase A